jgi:hypothetical protein
MPTCNSTPSALCSPTTTTAESSHPAVVGGLKRRTADDLAGGESTRGREAVDHEPTRQVFRRVVASVYGELLADVQHWRREGNNEERRGRTARPGSKTEGHADGPHRTVPDSPKFLRHGECPVKAQVGMYPVEAHGRTAAGRPGVTLDHQQNYT